jgi:hypothetical protein
MKTNESSVGAWAREGIAAVATKVIPNTAQRNRSQNIFFIVLASVPHSHGARFSLWVLVAARAITLSQTLTG